MSGPHPITRGLSLVPLWLVPLWQALRDRFSLREDKAADDAIDRDLRAGVEMRGTNLWVLMFAILIASVGLNVNSTAVIIGAMLISPLMGPILGIGYGVGVLDIALLRRSLKNLGIAVGIALATSTLYFLISPLNAADSELLARTTPTIWDVLIALCGGFAGIIGVTRREKTNIIPGVAIATALMPPLCTAGYGLAHARWDFMAGAIFLFAINCVFIAFSSAVVVRAFHLQQTRYVDATMATRVRRYMLAVVLCTLLPSAYFAYQMVQYEMFRARARDFVSAEFDHGQLHVAQSDIFPDRRQIEVTLIGDYIAPARTAEIESRMAASGLAGARLVLHQARDNGVDVTQLKTSLLTDLYARNQQALEEKDKVIAELLAHQTQLTLGRKRLNDMALELSALYPQLWDIVVTEGDAPRDPALPEAASVLVVNARSNAVVSGPERRKIRHWLSVRAPQAQSLLVIRR